MSSSKEAPRPPTLDYYTQFYEKFKSQDILICNWAQLKPIAKRFPKHFYLFPHSSAFSRFWQSKNIFISLIVIFLKNAISMKMCALLNMIFFQIFLSQLLLKIKTYPRYLSYLSVKYIFMSKNMISKFIIS